ncbi:hypothetical protein QQM39_30385 [Streptomyces sp. DT2A-34]|uniref:hypothetical protein n=1 Tax=Streptomyces sp. DT2A-34 TaxID=3051182 RepID=UPI00265BD28D|nr:hypothetical protein [Streptomyces sp. DT2A-34]MDO0914976.1 hypothetical protein [Streptomyces sp. DT2A-34]
MVAAATAAALAVSLSSAPASAATTSGCNAYLIPDFRAYGYADVTWGGKNTISALALYVKDIDADGHSVGIRLHTVTRDNNDHYWSWHRNYGGNGSGITYGTSATDSNGIIAARAQVGVFEGSSLLASCYTSAVTNPYA